MSIPTPDSGEVIEQADLIAMHGAFRTLVNALGQDSIGRHALGPQHVPSAVVGADSVCVTTEYEVVWDTSGGPPHHGVQEETTADISGGNWLTLTDYDLDNGGAGYTLPPCKVLVFFNCRVREFDPNDVDNQLWVNVHASIDGTPDYQLRQTGVLWPPEIALGSLNVIATEQAMSIAFVIDQTAAGGNWTLDYLRVKAGLGRGKAGSVAAFNAFITSGNMHFIAFYKDE